MAGNLLQPSEIHPKHKIPLAELKRVHTKLKQKQSYQLTQHTFGWSWLFCIQLLPCLVSFWRMLGGAVEV